MQLRGVHHVSINVSDLDEAVAFYVDVLGLERLPRPDDDISVAGAWLGLDDGRQVHLLVQDVPDNKGQHFAFAVDDVDAVVEELSERGVAVGDPKMLGDVCRQSFCLDPAGNVLEFNQRL